MGNSKIKQEENGSINNKLVRKESLRKGSVNEEETFPAFEKLLEQVGSEGVFQRRLIGWFMIPLSFLYGFAELNFILIVSTPDHTCHVPGRELFENITFQQWQNMTLPLEADLEGNMRYSQCKMYNISTSFDDMEGNSVLLDSNNEINCQFGWDYDTSVWKATAVSNFDWVCDQRGVVTMLLTLKMVGSAIGTFIFSVLSDRYGRLPFYYITLFICIIFGPAMALARNLVAFSIFEFILALAFYTLYQMPYLITLELCSDRLRSFIVISSFLSFISATCVLSLLSWLIAEWKLMLVVFHLPLAIFLFFWRLIPESPRWLLSQDKISKFKKLMKKIASVNGRELSNDFDDLILLAREQEKKKISFIQILRSPVLAKHLLVSSLVLSLGFMFVVGISFNLHNMTGNTFVNFFILSIFDIPGNIIGSLSSDFLGRRMSSVLFESLSAICILVTTAFLTNKWAVPVFCAISKMFTGGMIVSAYKQVGEMFPTPLRATAYGITGVIGIASTVIVPSLMAYGSVNPATPYYILCGFGALCAFFSTFLPETLGLPLPQTMKEATNIGKNQSYFSIIYKRNAHKLLNKPKDTTHQNGNIELSS